MTMKRSHEENVCEFYQEFSEERRLSKDQAHMVEFHTTMRYIRNHLITGRRCKILEVGCGTGAYSLELAREGHEVLATDISENNLDVLRKKVEEGMSLEIKRLNATDLSCIKDDTYDLTTVLGPIYHLTDDSDITLALSEVKRVTKRDGFIFLAFLSKDYILMRNCEEIFNESNEDIDSLIDGYSAPNGIFNYMTISEMEDVICNNDLELISIVSTDGITQFLEEKVNGFSTFEYNKFLEHHYKNCERRELMGYCAHILCITQNPKKELEESKV